MNTHTRTHACSHILTQRRTSRCSRPSTNKDKHLLTNKHTHMHTYIHTGTHTHTHKHPRYVFNKHTIYFLKNDVHLYSSTHTHTQNTVQTIALVRCSKVLQVAPLQLRPFTQSGSLCRGPLRRPPQRLLSLHTAAASPLRGRQQAHRLKR